MQPAPDLYPQESREGLGETESDCQATQCHSSDAKWKKFQFDLFIYFL